MYGPGRDRILAQTFKNASCLCQCQKKKDIKVQQTPTTREDVDNGPAAAVETNVV